METRPVKRQRLVVYLDPGVIRQLKRERGERDKPVGVLIEEAVRASRGRKPRSATA